MNYNSKCIMNKYTFFKAILMNIVDNKKLKRPSYLEGLCYWTVQSNIS